MGRVYQAEHTMLKTTVAIKELIDQFSTPQERQEGIDLFLKEAQRLTVLDHPMIVKVSDFFIEGNNYYLVMEYVDGQTLESLLKASSGGLPEAQVVDWAIKICNVLEYLHTLSPPVIFRDLKPANIMLTQTGRLKLIDFGIAREFKASATKDTQYLVSVGYSPPEQYGKGQTDARSDIHSLGATLHQLLTQRDPANDPFMFPPLRSINPAISGNMESIVAKCLQLDRTQRYPTVAKVRDVLRLCLPKPVLRLSMNNIDFGKLNEGGTMPTRTVTISNAGTGNLSWNVSSAAFFVNTRQVGNQLQVELKDIVGTHQGDIQITSNGGNATITVSAQVEKAAPTPVVVSVHPMSFTIISPIDGAEMILIPAGEFLMGTSDEQIKELLRQFPSWKREWFANERPQHRVYLDDFYIDKYPVTNAQFEQFVKATGYKAEGDWRRYYTKGKEKHPVVCVSWNAASAYCKWAGKRLPTEAEWEKAARGADGRIWPWGNAWDKSKCNSSDGGSGTTTPVGSYPTGASPYGVMDMAGNVLEWCADLYDEKYYTSAPDRNPQGPSSGTYRVLRGGSWYGDPDGARAATRYRNTRVFWGDGGGFRGVALRLPR
jgi:formylglycine-generating enzyme required for sulfatase activity